MKTIRVLKNRSAEFETFFAALVRRGAGSVGDVEQTVKKILEDVQRRGDEAVREFTARFDGASLKDFRVSPAMIRQAWKQADKSVVKILERAAARLTAFHARQKEDSWFFEDGDALLGQMVRPISRVGVYVPGGKASYPSSVLMNVIPAQVAGVKDIVLCAPTPRGEVNPHVIVAADMLGVTQIFRIGGAQAVAAMAFGTKSVPRVDKIVGPGNIYVATAKRMVFGQVDIDMIAGPSEILVIADASADPSFIAADMLGQAEHDELASAILVTPSRKLALAVTAELDHQLKKLKRREIAGKALDAFGAVVLTETLEEAAEVSNRLAPEHLEVMTERPMELLPRLKNAGAIFLGSWTPEALGDYMAGPNHTLPTGGTARFFSPLGTYDFVKRSSLLSFTRSSFEGLAADVEKLAKAEGLEAHGKSVAVRRKSTRPR